ncbi:MAG: cache domain-containing protein [Reichenbachiella sp.]
MKFRASKRLSISLLLAFLLSVYFLYDYVSYNNERYQTSLDEGQGAINDIQIEVESLLNKVIALGEGLKGELLTSNLSKEEINVLVKKYSHRMYHLHGVTIAYRKYGLDKETELFAPFYDKRRSRITNIDLSYDYTLGEEEKNQWYTEPLKNGANWTEPYLAKVAQLVVADYGIPFYKAGESEPAGVISFTLDLKKLSAKVDSLVVGRTGTGMITSPKGKFVAHPFPDVRLDYDLYKIAKDFDMERQVKTIQTQDNGHINYKKLNGQEAFSFFSKIPHTNWKTIITFNASDLLGNANLLHRKLIKIALSSSILVFLIFLGFQNFENSKQKQFWLVSVVLSMVIIVNIVLMWYLNLNFNYTTENKKEVRIESRAQLQTFVKKENHKLATLGLQRFIAVPTGIFVESLQFVDSYTISIRGELWQKWPSHLAKFYEPGFRFPQEAEAGLVRINKISEKVERKHVVHTWSFKLNLKMPLDYSKYPFDVRDLNIEIMYPDVESGVLLVPDVDGYSGLTPYSMPGINQDIYFKDSKLLASRFSFDILNFHSRFGHKKFSGINSFPIMKYTIHLKRRLLNVMVTNIIPILVVASMIFLIFYSITKNQEDKSGVSMMGVVQSCAGFFFVLLVAHIELRRRLTTPELTYIETFYLTMYVIMALLAINVVIFTKSEKYKLLSYKDNLLIKVSYWPFLLFSWMIITLIVFYF